MPGRNSVANDQFELVLREPHHCFVQPPAIAQAFLVRITRPTELRIHNDAFTRHGMNLLMQLQQASQALNVRRQPHIAMI